MSHPIDVGSVLGGRYKVTATVLTSHDQDLVLDGVDQVLNRPVSILVAGPGNADQVAQSAREVATGERPGHVQILDLGVSDAATYLITNHTSAADLLDLVVSSNPPYVEPFFTDTLGSEIFGQARSKEPETYDGLYDDEEVEAGYINYGDQQRQAGQRPPTPSAPPQRVPAPPAASPAAGARGAGAGARGAGVAGAAGAAGVAAGAAAASGAKSPKTAPQDAAPQPTAAHPVQPAAPAAQKAPAGETPKVSLWEDENYDYAEPDQRTTSMETPGSKGAGAGRAAGSFPAFARKGAAEDQYRDYDDDDENDDEPRREPRSMRWLVGALLAAVLVIGLIFAVTNLGGLFKGGTPEAAKTTPATGTPAQTGTATASQSAPPAAVPPAIESVTRQGNFDFAATYDGDLVKTYDGNAASYWSDMEFASDSWGGFAPDGVPLVVKLKGPAQISSVTLSQLGASGGNISIFTNDRPSLDGAKQVGSNSFTSPELTLPLPEPVTAQYVIVSIKSLPKLAAPKTRYGFGLRLAEIKVQ